MQTLNYCKRVEIWKKVDVFVAGGGPAGIAASVAAAKMGAKVLLVESGGCLGGMGTSGLVPSFCPFTDGINFLASGVGGQVYEKMFGSIDAEIAELGINAEKLKIVYDEILVDAGVNILFFTNLIDVKAEDGKIEYALCNSKKGIFAIEAKVFIDCTGDGDMAFFAGADYEKGDDKGNIQAGTLCSVWSNVDWAQYRQSGGNKYSRERMKEAIKDGFFSVPDPHLPGIWQVGENLAGANVGHVFNLDSTDVESITNGILQGRRLLSVYIDFYRKYVKAGVDEVELITSGSLMGVRESRRTIGRYTLNVEDYFSRAVFEDEIGRYCYNIDVHASSPNPQDFSEFERNFHQYRYKKGESYGIPYRILTPKGFSNLLTAGRCVSSDRAINGSLRVMPACFITGQAAGVASAIAAEQEKSVSNIDVAQLQANLKHIGAFLPNFKEKA